MGSEKHTNSDKEDEWASKHLHIHLKKEQLKASPEEKATMLKKRRRSRWWMLMVNVIAILFFGYSFYFDITQLSNTLLYVLFAVFIINMVLIFYQTKQLKRLITYLENRKLQNE